MLFVILAFLISVILDLVIFRFFSPEINKILGIISLILITMLSLAFLYFDFNIFSIVFSYFSVFRIINYFKIIDSNKQIIYLRNSFLKTFQALITIQALLLSFNYLFNKFIHSFIFEVIVLITIQILTIIVLLYSTYRSSVKLLPSKINKFLNDRELPSITVAIPARNEDQDLEECLNSLILSDYPKLEIIVLDDCSQSKKVAEIIRSFAHAGVVFLEGKVPPNDYLAKNYAYEQLSEASNGQIIVFTGADVRFEKDSLRKIVEFMISKNKRMISLLPSNDFEHLGFFKAMLAQPLRYLWEISLPRRFLNRPPVLSTLWAIYKEDLLDFGDFKGLKRDIIPERTIAKKLAYSKDGYSFMFSNDVFNILSVKDFNSQIETSIRLKYPSLKQRLDYLSFVIIFEILILLIPLFEVVYSILKFQYWLTFISLLMLILFNLIYYFVVKVSYKKSFKSVLVFGFIAGIYDIYLWFMSMYMYEFKEVIWKGRNVCIPVMGSSELQDSELR